jgi:hypothetical protein
MLWVRDISRERAELVMAAIEVAEGTGEPERWIPCRPTHPRAEWRIHDALTGQALFALRPEEGE